VPSKYTYVEAYFALLFFTQFYSFCTFSKWVERIENFKI